MGLFGLGKRKQEEIPATLPPLPDLPPPPTPEPFATGVNPPSFENPSYEHEQNQPSYSQPMSSAMNVHPPVTIQPVPADNSQKDFQLIMSRLETITAELDSIKQRIIHIERIAEASQQKEPPKRYGW